MKNKHCVKCKTELNSINWVKICCRFYGSFDDVKDLVDVCVDCFRDIKEDLEKPKHD